MEKYSIYRITNVINNKKYIGFTGNFEKRLKQHISPKYKKEKPLVSKAIEKYGLENFKFEVIYESLDRDHCLNEMEPYFIMEEKSYDRNYGYNLTFGGDGVKPTKETREKISKSSIGKIPWNKNKTKYNDFRIANYAETLSIVNKGKIPAHTTSDYRWVHDNNGDYLVPLENIDYSKFTSGKGSKFQTTMRNVANNRKIKNNGGGNFKQIETPFGIFSSLKEASETIQLSKFLIRKKLKTDPKEWKFI